jgi:hypothetical protein
MGGQRQRKTNIVHNRKRKKKHRKASQPSKQSVINKFVFSSWSGRKGWNMIEVGIKKQLIMVQIKEQATEKEVKDDNETRQWVYQFLGIKYEDAGK